MEADDSWGCGEARLDACDAELREIPPRQLYRSNAHLLQNRPQVLIGKRRQPALGNHRLAVLDNLVRCPNRTSGARALVRVQRYSRRSKLTFSARQAIARLLASRSAGCPTPRIRPCLLVYGAKKNAQPDPSAKRFEPAACYIAQLFRIRDGFAMARSNSASCSPASNAYTHTSW